MSKRAHLGLDDGYFPPGQLPDINVTIARVREANERENAQWLEQWMAEHPPEQEKPQPQRRQQHKPGDLLTGTEAAAKLRCSLKTLKAHVASGALRYVNIGIGGKRIRMRFTDDDLNTFIAHQTKEEPCPSTKTHARRIGNFTSGAEVIAFSALPKPRPGAKRKP